jgi:dihydrofolate reductase
MTQSASGQPNQRRFRYYFACSLDGYIADAQGGIAWLEPFQAATYGFNDFIAEVDTAIMGRKTFEHTLQLTKGKGMGMRTHVLTSRAVENLPPGTTTTRDIAALVRELRAQPGKDVWIMGGGVAARSLLEADAVDEIEMHVIPVVLGAGLPMFGAAVDGRPFRLEVCDAKTEGVVHLVYRR